jgi:two-component system, chemotaxis family, protein-glutamate methylesterase/glutaminase
LKNPSKIRVLIVDDSSIVRKLLSDLLAKDPEIEVVGTAIDPYLARDKVIELEPDVMTLDIEMPRMDGLTFLKIMMKHHPMPIIIMSSLTQSGSQHAMEALQAGAAAVLAKPGGSFSVGDVGERLIGVIKEAGRSKLRFPKLSATAAAAAAASAPASNSPNRAQAVVSTNAAVPPTRLKDNGHHFDPRQIILLGASTGGTEALRDVLVNLPANMPGICIVQHIPAYFSKAFADRLNSLCALEVREAVDGDRVTPGLALVAPGDYHMLLRWQTDHYRVQLKQGPLVWHQRPAVDVLFKSGTVFAAPYTVAGLLTGMGKDGAEGLLALREKGARTFAQNEESCVVFGMPRAAMELGAAEQMIPLDDFPHVLQDTATRFHPPKAE